MRTLAVLALLVSPPILDRSGSWTLARLGAGARAHVVAADPGFTFTWRAPAHVRQGAHGRWYLVRFHAQLLLDLRRTTFEAAGDLESSDNGLVCASDLVDERLVGDSVVYSWYGGDGIVEAGGTPGQPVLDIDDTTVCIIPAIRPGVNTVQLRATGFGEHARLVVLPTSGVIVRAGRMYPPRHQPPRVALHVFVPTDVTSGSNIDVRVAATSKHAVLSISAPPGPLRIAGKRTVNVSGHVVQTFRLRARSAGTAWFVVRAGGERRLVVLTIH